MLSILKPLKNYKFYYSHSSQFQFSMGTSAKGSGKQYICHPLKHSSQIISLSSSSPFLQPVFM